MFEVDGGSPMLARTTVSFASFTSIALLFASSTAALAAPAAPTPGTGKAPAALTVPAEAKRLETAFANVGERLSASVVQVDVLERQDAEDRFTRWLSQKSDSPVAHGAGSGVVFSADGSILTNDHLIDDALAIQVRLADGRVLPARLVGRDPGTDLAMLKVEAQGLTAARFSDGDARVGQWVVAVGSPFGTGITVSTGVVGAKGRSSIGAYAVDDYLQTDAAISPTNSGGAVCDLEGRVLGIASDWIGRGSGVGFAVPSSLAKRVAADLLKTGHVVRPWLGATLQDLTPDLAALMKLDAHAGVIISSVADAGPAKKANLSAGDVIATIGGKAVHDPADLQREVLARDVGQAVALEVLRSGQRYATQVTLTARPESALPPVPAQQAGVPQVGLGFNVRDLTPQETAQRGLGSKPMPVVTVVAPGSSADRAGVRVGDVIVEADGIVEPSTQKLQQASQDGQLLLRVRRRDMAFYAAVRK
jgi:serine protease Do